MVEGISNPPIPPKPKESSGKLSAYQCPMLTPVNYTVWAVRMKVILNVHKVWNTIDPGDDDADKNMEAMALLFQSIPESNILQICNLTTAKAIWDAIKLRNLGEERVREARLQTLMTEFDAIKMRETETIDEFVTKLSGIATKSAALGEVMEESKLVKKFLKALPRSKFIQIVASIEQSIDLKNTGFEDVVGRLKAYEERIREEEYQNDHQGKLMYHKAESSSAASARGNNQGGGGRRGGRGGSRGRGGRGFGYNRGHQDANTVDNRDKKGKARDLSKIQCYRCDKFGHFVSNCPDRKQKQQHEANLTEGNETGDPTLFMLNCSQETIYLNEGKVIPRHLDPKKDNVWYLDNGASNHMSGKLSLFSEINKGVKGKVKFGDDSYVNICGKGSIIFEGQAGEHKLLTDVYYIPSLKANILSLGQASESGCDIHIKDNYLTMHDREGKLMMKVNRSPNRLYFIHLKVGKPICLLNKIDETSWLWHARLGHLNFEAMKLMSMKDMVVGMPRIDHETKLCESCLVGKQTRLPFPRSTSYRATSPLELVHGDLCGPITPSTLAGNTYIFVLIDDYSRYTWTFLLKSKDEAFGVFKRFKIMVEGEVGMKIRTFRTDRGGEFNSLNFNKFCEQEGIKRNLTAPYTPQQNGVVERKNRTLLDMTRSMLKAMCVPNFLWGEAIRHATFIDNRTPTRALKNTTPYEMLKKKKPSVSYLKVFGCLAFAKINTRLKKLDDRSKSCIYLGSEQGSKAFRLFDPSTHKVIISHDVVFDEKKMWQWEDKGSSEQEPGYFWVDWNGVIDGGLVSDSTGSLDNEYSNNSEDDNQTSPINSSSQTATSQSASVANTQNSATSSNSNSLVTTSSQTSESYSNNELQSANQNVRRSNRVPITPVKFNDYVMQIDDLSLLLNEEKVPRNFEEAKSKPEWMMAMQSELDSINRTNTWKLTDLPKGAKVIGVKWLFKVKRNADGSIYKHKARLVAKGYVQEPGIDYDEVFAPVARMETVRLIIAIAANHGWDLHHLDVKTAFLHGDLKEEIYVAQPDGFVKVGEEHKVLKLLKSLYGLKQSPRAWNMKLDEILKGLKFEKCLQEHAVYRREIKDDLIVIGVYVDDLIVTGSNMKIIKEFKRAMSSKFEMTDLGKLTYYLGIEVKYENNVILLHQEAYARKVLKEAGMEFCNPTHVPMNPNERLTLAEDEADVEATKYRKIVGCLRYMLHTRPDMAFSVGMVSRYMQTPKVSHLAAIKQILRYLKGTVSYGLSYKKGGMDVLTGYSDSSHNIDDDDGRSTSGHVFYLGESPITWCSQKQSTVALSSCEAEYMAANSAACQAVWLRELLGEITGTTLQKVVIKVDNTSAIALVKNPVFHKRSKHIKSRFHYIRECVGKDEIEVEHVDGKEQKADILTKALARVKFNQMRKLLGVEDLLVSTRKLGG